MKVNVFGVIAGSLAIFIGANVLPCCAQGSYMNTGSDTFLVPLQVKPMGAAAPYSVPASETHAPIAPVLMPTSSMPNGPYYPGSTSYIRQVFPGQICPGKIFPGWDYAGMTGIYLTKPAKDQTKAATGNKSSVKKGPTIKSSAQLLTANVVDQLDDAKFEASHLLNGPLGMSDVHITHGDRFNSHRNRWMIYEDGNGAVGGAYSPE